MKLIPAILVLLIVSCSQKAFVVLGKDGKFVYVMDLSDSAHKTLYFNEDTLNVGDSIVSY